MYLIGKYRYMTNLKLCNSIWYKMNNETNFKEIFWQGKTSEFPKILLDSDSSITNNRCSDRDENSELQWWRASVLISLATEPPSYVNEIFWKHFLGTKFMKHILLVLTCLFKVSFLLNHDEKRRPTLEKYSILLRGKF